MYVVHEAVHCGHSRKLLRAFLYRCDRTPETFFVPRTEGETRNCGGIHYIETRRGWAAVAVAQGKVDSMSLTCL